MANGKKQNSGQRKNRPEKQKQSRRERGAQNSADVTTVPSKEKRRRRQTTQRAKKDFGDFPLKKENFIVIGCGFALIILGYILMYGTENIFSFSKMGLPVIVILTGFGIQIYGIMGKPNFLGSRTSNTEQSSPQ
jgi:hypothetical protein